MNASLWPLLIPTTGAVIVAVVTGVYTILSGRRKATGDVQAIINKGFTELVDNLREQVDFQKKRIDDLEGYSRDCEMRLGICEAKVRRLIRFIHTNELKPPV
jgi:hypothetical protein